MHQRSHLLAVLLCALVCTAAGTPEHQAYVQLLTAQAAASGLRSNASHDETVLRLLQELAATPGSTAEAAKWNLDHLNLRSYFVDQ